jgi:hypothetical protein
MDEVGVPSRLGHRPVEVRRAEQVRLEGLLDRGVEGHGRRAVEDHIEIDRERGNVPRHVPLQDRDAFGQDVLHGGRADHLAEPGEDVAGHQLLDPGLRLLPEPAPDEQDDPGLGEIGQQPGEQGGAQEARDARDEDALVTEAGHQALAGYVVPGSAGIASVGRRVGIPALYHAADYSRDPATEANEERIRPGAGPRPTRRAGSP